MKVGKEGGKKGRKEERKEGRKEIYCTTINGRTVKE